jgi:hypothetical protein
MNNLKLEEIRKKIEQFKKAKVPVHIVLKASDDEKKYFQSLGSDIVPRFLNGYIIGKKSKDVYIIDEKKIGETYVLLDDIYNVTIYVKSNRELSEEVLQRSGFKMGEGVSKDEINLLRDINKK